MRQEERQSVGPHCPRTRDQTRADAELDHAVVSGADPMMETKAGVVLAVRSRTSRVSSRCTAGV